jgi:hypothetical protein
MFLTNVILSTILAIHPISHMGNTNNVRVMNDNQAIKAMFYLQSFDLIYKDIYDYTMPNLNKERYILHKYQSPGERNPVAGLFFQYNLWDAAFIGANALNLYIMNLDDSFFKFYAPVLSAVEVLAISTWGKWTSDKINIKAELFVYTF